MKTIWKLRIPATDKQVISVPGGAQCLWALVDPEAKREPRTIEIFGTGDPMPDFYERKYIGTYQLAGGSLVFHVFERIG